MKILVTGASGFVGKEFCFYLKEQGFDVIGVVRSLDKQLDGIRCIVIDSINANTNWGPHLDKVDVIVHLAARAHVLNDSSLNPLEEFRAVNTFGTEKLVAESVKAGVGRFIFLSSIGVNGGATRERPFEVSDAPRPHSPYAVSKLEAENILVALSEKSSMDYVILRPPLIYGRGAPGNVGLIQKLLHYRVPLPFGAIENKRSFISIDNVISLLGLCVTHSRVRNRALLISDGVDLSTTEFVNLIGDMMGKRPLNFRVSPKLLNLVLKIAGKGSVAESLLSDLRVDSDYLFGELNWKPTFDAESWLNNRNKSAS